MTEVADTVDDALDALGATPSSDEVLFATEGFSAREIAAAAAAVALSGGVIGGALTLGQVLENGNDAEGATIENLSGIAINKLPGATADVRWAGGTESGAPTTGTFEKGDAIIARNGHLLVCTTAGSPGSWTDVGSPGTVASVFGRSGVVTPQTGDYTAAQVGALSLAGMTVDVPKNGYTLSSPVRRSAASFGVKADGRMLTGISVTATALTASGASFTAADVGKTVCLYNANGTGVIGQAVVSAYVSATALTLATSITTSSNKYAVIGTDDTATWQAAIDWGYTDYTGGRVEWDGLGTGISLLAGAQRTGTVTSTNAHDTGTEYAYSGQLLLPAHPIGGAQQMMEIAGSLPFAGIWSPQHLQSVDEQVLAPSAGLRILTTGTSGWVIDAIPDPAGFPWDKGALTFIQFGLRRVTVRKLLGSAIGGLNLLNCASAILSEVSCDLSDVTAAIAAGTPPSTTGTSTHAGSAIVMPGAGNYGVAELRHSQVMGWAKGVSCGASGHLDGVAITHCGAGLSVGYLSDRNGDNDIHALTVNNILLQNNDYHIEAMGNGRQIHGFVEIEAPNVSFLDDPSGLLHGDLLVGGLDTTPVRAGRLGSNGLSIRTHMNPFPPSANRAVSDTLMRSDMGVAGFGLADGSNHGAYASNMSTTSTGAYVLGAGGGSTVYVVPTPHVLSRKISATLHTSSTAARTWMGLAARLQNASTGDMLKAIFSNASLGTGVYLYKGAYAGATQLATAAYSFSTNTEYAIDLIVQSSDIDGADTLATVWVNGVRILAYTLSAAEAVAYPASGSDGITGFVGATTDNGGSRIKNLTIKPATDLPYVTAGTATLVGGSVDISNTAITANANIRIFRAAIGGTLGHLSVALTAATKFTVNSSSGSDTSTVYYEVVNY